MKICYATRPYIKSYEKVKINSLILSENCRIETINGKSYFVAGRKDVNIDRVILCRILTNLLGFEVSQRRLKDILPFWTKLCNPKSWHNQCLCGNCSNCDFSVAFLNKVGTAAGDPLLKIINLESLIEIVCCDDIDKRMCLANLSNLKCFLHGSAQSSSCEG